MERPKDLYLEWLNDELSRYEEELKRYINRLTSYPNNTVRSEITDGNLCELVRAVDVKIRMLKTVINMYRINHREETED